MLKSELRILSMTGDMAFVLQSYFIEHVEEFLTLFKHHVDHEQKVIWLEHVQQNSRDLRDRIDSYVKKYQSITPQVNKLKQIVSNMNEGEFYLLLPNQVFGTSQLMDYHIKLKSLNENVDSQPMSDQFRDLFGCVWRNYDTSSFGNSHRQTIGEPNKRKRVCRFCGRANPAVNFIRKAHAISEALGNKNLVLNEECDECNEHFGNGIERDLITYLDFFRSFYGITGKRGKPKLKGTNFTIREGKNGVEILSSDVTSDTQGLPSVELQIGQRIVLQNVYRALCKYALSVIDRENLQSYQKTIRWIRGESINTRVPKIATLLTYRFMEESPSIAIYLRKNCNTDLPHLVGEFRFTCLVFVFIVPLSLEDEKNFCNDTDFNSFWDCFKHYRKNEGWTFQNFSDENDRGLTINADFVKRKQSKNKIGAPPT